MQNLKRKAIFLGLVLVLELGVCCCLIIKQSYILLIILAVPMPAAAAGFYHRLQKFKSARLITENAILRIPGGTVWSGRDGSMPAKTGSPVPVNLSGFGVLAGEEVYKFNCDGIRLFSVEMDREYILLTYGTKDKQHHLRIGHLLSGEDDMLDIAGKILYETGVNTDLTGW
jgi:hypothetical protein